MLMILRQKAYENIVGRGGFAIKQHFLPFLQCFLPYLKQIPDLASLLLSVWCLTLCQRITTLNDFIHKAF